MPVPFITGFNDDFNTFLALPNNGAPLFDRVVGCNGKILRTRIEWARVQPEQTTSPLKWEDADPAYNYKLLRDVAAARNLIVLPKVFSPPSWVPRAASPNGSFYPTEAGWEAYAQFCVEVLKYFSAKNTVKAVEVWNEPNHPTRQSMPASNFGGMVASTAEAVFYANQSGSIKDQQGNATTMSVASGGLLMDHTEEKWKTYLHEFLEEQCYPIKIGFHPYDLRTHAGESVATAQAEIPVRITDQIDQALALTSQDLWVTETGCASGPKAGSPFTVSMQANVLSNLCGTGGVFASRSRCKAVIIQSLKRSVDLDPSSIFATFGVVNDDPPYVYKEPTHNYLQSNWAP